MSTRRGFLKNSIRFAAGGAAASIILPAARAYGAEPVEAVRRFWPGWSKAPMAEWGAFCPVPAGMVFVDGVDIEEIHSAIHVAWPAREAALEYVQRFDDLYIAEQRLALLRDHVWDARVFVPRTTDSEIVRDILKRAGVQMPERDIFTAVAIDELKRA